MKTQKVSLVPLRVEDREQFILDNQWAFKYGAICHPGVMTELGQRNNSLDNFGEIISRKTIEHCLDEEGNETYQIIHDGRIVGGVVLKINRETNYNYLELFFVLPDDHGKGIGYEAWKAVEAMYPETEVWETQTPYFEKRNIHFYVNKCGFKIVEFFNEFHIDSQIPQEENIHDEGPEEMFRFTKIM